MARFRIKVVGQEDKKAIVAESFEELLAEGQAKLSLTGVPKVTLEDGSEIDDTKTLLAYQDQVLVFHPNQGLRSSAERYRVPSTSGADNTTEIYYHREPVVDEETLRKSEELMEKVHKGDGSTSEEDFPKDELADINTLIKKHGARFIKDVAYKKMKDLEETPLNIAVTGKSGSGKSSFLNTIRGLTADDEGAAAVGVTETTTKPKPFVHPKHKNLVFWDLPGVSTSKFPRETYAKDIGLETYDMFLIITSDRLNEDDTLLADLAKKKGKPFFIVRNKIDQALHSEKHNHPKRFSEQNVLREVRNDLKGKTKGLQPRGVYLISALEISSIDQRDFPDLVDDMVSNAPGFKREAMLFAFKANSSAAIAEKANILRGMVWRWAMSSAVGSVVPVAGLAVDVGVLISAHAFIKKQFGLDENDVKEKIGGEGMAKLSAGTKLMMHIGTKELFEETISSGIKSAALFSVPLPVVLGIISAGVATYSFYSVRSTLNKLIEDCENASTEILNLTIKRLDD